MKRWLAILGCLALGMGVVFRPQPVSDAPGQSPGASAAARDEAGAPPPAARNGTPPAPARASARAAAPPGAAAGPAAANASGPSEGTAVITRRAPDAGPDPLRKLAAELEPRRPHPPKALIMVPGSRQRITVKFSDAAVARMTGTGGLSVVEASDADLAALDRLARAHGLRFTPVFDQPERVDALRERAARKSGRMQADLNGTMHVEVAASGVLEVARALHSLALVESVDLDALDAPPPPPADIPPATPSLVGSQTYRGGDPGYGVDYVLGLGITGAGVRLADCEYGFNPGHEDLVGSAITNASRAPINAGVYSNNWDEHGTAVMGILAAGANGYGVSGIAPGCEVRFHSEWTTLGWNRPRAIEDAIAGSREGDVILLEMQATGPLPSDNNYAPAEYDSGVWNLVRTATDAGIIVVAAAGNGGHDLDGAAYASYMARGDSGAILVGAGTDTTKHARRSSSNYGTRVDVQAWGTGVATAGYGTLAKYGNDTNQYYASSFSGTSAASASVAGAVVLLQSYARTVLRTTFTPAEMRAHLKQSGHPQGGGGAIGPAIALDSAVQALPGRPMAMAVEPGAPHDLTLRFWGLPFRTYRIEASTNLRSWTNFATGLSGGANAVELPIEDEKSMFHARFYRLGEE